MIDLLLIPGKYNKKIIIPDIIMDKIPKKIILFGSVQFLNQLPEVEKQLESKGITAIMLKSKNFLYNGLITDKGQLLGCNAENFQEKDIEFDAFLYIGDGIFHPKALAVNNFKDIYCYNPRNDQLNVIKKEEHQMLEKRKKGNLIKFLSSKNIGILITTKVGQNSTKRAESLKKKIMEKWPEKKVFMFMAAEINFGELENFNFIDVYINSACSRIGHDDTVRSEKTIVNIGDVEKMMK